MRNSKYLLLLLAGALVFQGCALGTLQTAQTTPKGNVELYVGGNTSPNMEAGAFLPQTGFRMGLSDNLDIGFSLFGLGIFTDLKLALFQTKGTGPSLALTGGIGYSSVFGEARFYTVDLGGIFSIELGGIAPYASFRLRKFGFTDSSSGDLVDDLNGEFGILNIGIALFSRSKLSLFVEGTYFKNVRILDTEASTDDMALISAGIRIKFY